MGKAVIATQCDRGRGREAGVVTQCPHECLEGTLRGEHLRGARGRTVLAEGMGICKSTGRIGNSQDF